MKSLHAGKKFSFNWKQKSPCQPIFGYNSKIFNAKNMKKFNISHNQKFFQTKPLRSKYENQVAKKQINFSIVNNFFE